MNKVLLVGENPNGFSGNSLMMKSIIDQIHDHELAVFCPSVNIPIAPFEINPYNIIPSDDLKTQDFWGRQKLLHILDNNEFNFVIFVGIDIWRYIDIIQYVKQIQQKQKFKIIHLFPYDFQFLDKESVQYANLIDMPFVYSQYGFDMLKDHVPNLRYFRPDMPQKELFFPYSEEKRQEARSILFPTISPDTFVFGFIGPNQIRKDPQKIIKAFSLIRNYTDKRIVLYMHTNFKDGVYNLQKYAIMCGLDSGSLLVKPEGSYSPFEKMPDIYNSLDCFINCSLQEGLSWTTIQAMLCGVPVIASDSTAHKELIELVGGNKVECNSPSYIPIQTSQGQTWIDAKCCTPDDIAFEMAGMVSHIESFKGLSAIGAAAIQEWSKGYTDVLPFLKERLEVVSEHKKERILFIQHSSAGDVLMTTRCLKNIRLKHGNLPLDYMTQEKFHGILENNYDIAKILDWNPELRTKYQFVYNPHGEHILKGGFNNLDVKLADMYPYFCKVEPGDFFIDCEQPDDFFVHTENKPYIVVHTTGGDPKYRTYNHMGIVIKGLKLPVIQIGLKTDLYCPGAIDLRGILSFIEMAWVMKKATAAIVVDSFPSHLAGAVNTPCIVLYGPAPARVVGPVHGNQPWYNLEPNKLDVCASLTNCHGQNTNCLSPCINTINPLKIKEILIKILGELMT